MEATCSHLLDLLLISFFLLSPRAFAADTDTFSKGRNITDNETLVSANGAFTMGFFSPGVSTKRYLAIWFSVSRDAVCWVANRDRPINDNSGVLMVSDTGSLLLLDGTGRIAWSSNSSSTSPVEAKLLENGNLVVRNPGSTTTGLWNSFDHPSNVLLSGMKVGKDFSSGDEWYLTSWRSADDPSPGAYTRKLDTAGRPDNIVWQGDVKTFRTGPWNGVRFGGIPEVLTYQKDLFEYQMVISPREVTYGYNVKPGAAFTYVVLTENGEVRRLVWDAGSRAWQTNYQGPRDVCDAYGRCGAFNLCNVSAAAASFCGCIRGFGLASSSRISGRCRRNVALDCAKGATTDGFVLVPGVKLPDTHNASVYTGITVEDCRARCLANCSCLAYAAADISGGGDGSGCIMWTDDLLDMRYVDRGQDLYLRLARSELPPSLALPPPPPPSRARPFPTGPVIGASIGSLVGIFLIAFLVLVLIRRRRRRSQRPSNPAPNNSIIPHTSPAPTVPSTELSSLRNATGDFSESNIIGRGGFGIVYEGRLPDGRKVAVKKLIPSSLTEEGSNAFMREVEVMSKLRHGNLLQLLSYCQEGNERVLVYEYMKHKSLNIYIFGDPRLRALLNWERRLEIVRGIAKGVAYLHGLSEEVIHRDLKPSNILLDDNWWPKIADFGTAKLFVVDQTDPTLIQSAGYTAPEYSNERHLTLKCDVYSFGIILLEIVSGKRNRTNPTLLSNAWESWNQARISDLRDPDVAQPEPELLFGLELERCVQIGLLCVQQLPDDRPAMSAVVAMLNTNSLQIREPKRPELDSRTEPPLHEADHSTQEASGTSRSSYSSVYLT